MPESQCRNFHTYAAHKRGTNLGCSQHQTHLRSCWQHHLAWVSFHPRVTGCHWLLPQQGAQKLQSLQSSESQHLLGFQAAQCEGVHDSKRVYSHPVNRADVAFCQYLLREPYSSSEGCLDERKYAAAMALQEWSILLLGPCRCLFSVLLLAFAWRLPSRLAWSRSLKPHCCVAMADFDTEMWRMSLLRATPRRQRIKCPSKASIPGLAHSSDVC